MMKKTLVKGLMIAVFSMHLFSCAHEGKKMQTGHSSNDSYASALDVIVKIDKKFQKKIKRNDFMIWSISDVSTGNMVAVGLIESPKFPLSIKLNINQLLVQPEPNAPLAMSVRIVKKKNIFSPPLKGQIAGYLGGVREETDSKVERKLISNKLLNIGDLNKFKIDHFSIGKQANLEINRIIL